MKKFKDLTSQEKMMISFVIVLLLAIALSWSRITQGLQKGMKTFTEQPTNK